jgi:hypothetical protein
MTWLKNLFWRLLGRPKRKTAIDVTEYVRERQQGKRPKIEGMSDIEQASLDNSIERFFQEIGSKPPSGSS